MWKIEFKIITKIASFYDVKWRFTSSNAVKSRSTAFDFNFIQLFLSFYISFFKINPIFNAPQIIHTNRIKEVLEDKGIKQTWLAEKLGKSYNMVNAYV